MKKADFNKILRAVDQEVLLQSSTNAQELSFEKSDMLSTKDLAIRLEESFVKINLTGKQGQLKLTPEAIGLEKSWEPYQTANFTFRNLSDSPVKIAIVLWSHRGRLPDTLYLKSSERQTKQTDLLDLPLLGRPNKKYDVNEIQLILSGEESGVEVQIEDISLVNRLGPLSQVVDKFGQRISTNWDGKVIQESELSEHLEGEKESLTNRFKNQKFDKYLGIINGENYGAEGYFKLHMEPDSTWFFVTPEGNPFWSLGVTGIRPKKPLHDVTLIKGNEHLFVELPDRNGEYGAAYIDTTFSFYHLNLLKKYGDLDAWREMVFQRLNSWGINTIGNWSEEELLMQSEVPFTFSFISGIEEWNRDSFHPDWFRHMDSLMAKAGEFRNNSYLLGYFVDNEAGWGNPKLAERLPENAYLREVWIDTLKNSFSTINIYNKNRETTFESWETLKNGTRSDIIPDQDRILLESLYADKYFSSIATLLKKHDPNHLYLGCRFTRKLKPVHIMQIAGKYCDVVTVNVYSYSPIKEQMDAWHKTAGRPILIGEHQAALKSSRQLPLRWRDFDESERRRYYKNYVKTWSNMPYALGSHWYQFADQHITGRASNGENQLVGFVDITDQPHVDLVETARVISDSIYYWHGISKNDAVGEDI